VIEASEHPADGGEIRVAQNGGTTPCQRDLKKGLSTLACWQTNKIKNCSDESFPAELCFGSRSTLLQFHEPL